MLYIQSQVVLCAGFVRSCYPSGTVILMSREMEPSPRDVTIRTHLATAAKTPLLVHHSIRMQIWVLSNSIFYKTCLVLKKSTTGASTVVAECRTFARHNKPEKSGTVSDVTHIAQGNNTVRKIYHSTKLHVLFCLKVSTHTGLLVNM